MYKIIKGEVRKVRKGGSGEREFFCFFLFFFVFFCFFLFFFCFVLFFLWLQLVLEPRYQTTLHETQTRQDSRNVT